MPKKSIKNLREIASTALDLVLLRYPGFVYGESCSRAMPVFCFHRAEPESFEAMLAFLDTNGYVTLDADQYYALVTGREGVPHNAVVLTFDDGWGSLWSIGFPLLKKYGVKIVVFLPSGRIERGGCGPNLDDPRAGACPEDEALGRDRSAHPFLTWEEIAVMHASGLVDFQSHSYSHGLVYRGPKVVDFASPAMLEKCNPLEMPLGSCDGHPIGVRPPIRLGEPLYESASRLSDVPRLIVDPSLADRCAALVECSGGAEFFRTPGWRKKLERLAREVSVESARGWPVETPDEQVEAVCRELAESKATIERMLPGKVVRHICYPWHVAGNVAKVESRKVGYDSNFWGRVGGRYYNPIPYDPYSIARLSGDFFFRLPGKGRIGLPRILLRKAVRRAREGSPYLTH